jgi:adenylate kinase family enzyme
MGPERESTISVHRGMLEVQSKNKIRLAILGNSGSGKSTLARWLSERTDAALLDLDTVAWEPDRTAVARSDESASADVRAFCSVQGNWVIEGCYANLMRVALDFGPRLVFLNPGLEQCIANCRSRPWEPHKYASKQQQDERLSFLLTWVGEYYTRDGAMSLAAHVDTFRAYRGPKEELRIVPMLNPPSPEVVGWLSSVRTTAR